MTKQIIYILFIANCFNCLGQESKIERQISIGVYGIGYPTKYHTNIHAGALLDVSLKDKKRLCLSSSLNYTVFYHSSYQFHNFSMTSGLSWKLKKKNLSLRPGIQLGYLYQNRENYADFLFHGVFVRLSTELTYVINRFEYGLQFNTGVGYGPTRYYYSYEPTVKNKFGFMGGFGIELKYHLYK